MGNIGHTQEQILVDARKKKIFTMADVQRYYSKPEEAMVRFDSLVTLGHFEKGVNKATGEIVYISKLCEATLFDFTASALRPKPNHPDLFKCPQAQEMIKDFDLTDIDTCESYCLGEGCKYIPTCPAYKEHGGLK